MPRRLLISFILAMLLCGAAPASSEPAAAEYVKANQLFASARFEQALALYQKLLASPPRGVSASEIQSRIGDSWFRLGSFQKSLDAYRSAIAGQKESARAETQYWIGFCCFLLGRDAESVSEFLKIPASYPSSGMWVGTAYYWAGRASERMGRTDQAAEYYRKAGGNGRSTQGRFALKKAESVKKN